MAFGDALFRSGGLSDHLSRRGLAVQSIVTARVNDSNATVPAEELAALFARELLVQPVQVDFDAVEKSVREQRVVVNDFERRVEIDGILATRTFPFTGEEQLFSMQPSSYSLSVPYGKVEGNKVSIASAGRATDAEAMKAELDKLQALLKEYLERQAQQINVYNEELVRKFVDAINARRKVIENVNAAKKILG